jgi:hypothetical protein
VVVQAQWFLGWKQSEREHGDENLLSVVIESAGPKFLVCGT